MSTAVHAWMPELAVSVGAPRVVGIGYPGALPFGRPGDAQGQRDVLLEALKAAVGITVRGGRVDLDFEWPRGQRIPRPPTPPPIAKAIMRRPWLLMNLMTGKIP